MRPLTSRNQSQMHSKYDAYGSDRKLENWPVHTICDFHFKIRKFICDQSDRKWCVRKLNRKVCEVFTRFATQIANHICSIICRFAIHFWNFVFCDWDLLSISWLVITVCNWRKRPQFDVYDAGRQWLHRMWTAWASKTLHRLFRRAANTNNNEFIKALLIMQKLRYPSLR